MVAYFLYTSFIENNYTYTVCILVYTYYINTINSSIILHVYVGLIYSAVMIYYNCMLLLHKLKQR
jgi:hypothetical protein